MHIETVVVGEFQVNCLIVWAEGSREALVVDPGAEADRIRQAIDRRGLTVAAYLLTHGHVDHVSAVADLYDWHAAPVAIHAKDAEWAFSPMNALQPFYGPPRPPPEVARLLADDQEWNDGGLAYRVLHTPGHSPGCVCFWFPSERVVLTGDTLFAGSVGRTDLPGGSARLIQHSLRRLATLPDETAVYAGHGPETTIGEEKRTNFFMRTP